MTLVLYGLSCLACAAIGALATFWTHTIWLPRVLADYQPHELWSLRDEVIRHKLQRPLRRPQRRRRILGRQHGRHLA